MSLKNLTMDEYISLSKSDPDLVESLHREYDQEIEDQQLYGDDEDNYDSYPSTPPDSEPTDSEPPSPVKPTPVSRIDNTKPKLFFGKPKPVITKSK